MSITKLLGRKFFTGKKTPDITTSPQEQISCGGGLPNSPVQAANAAPDMRVGAGWGEQIQPLPTDGADKNLQTKTHPCKMANGLPKKPAFHSLNPSSSQSSARKRHSKADKVSFMRTALNKSVSMLTALCMVPALSLPSGISADQLRLEMLSDDAAVTAVESDEAQADTNIVESDPTDTIEIPTAASADDPDDETGEGNTNNETEADNAATNDNENTVTTQESDATQTTVTVGSFNVTGGIQGVDWDYDTVDLYYAGWGAAESYTTDNYATNNISNVPGCGSITKYSPKMLIIKSDTHLTISTDGTSAEGIYIQPGTQAYLTFNNVNIQTYLPLDIATNKQNTVQTEGAAVSSCYESLKSEDLGGQGTSLTLILADGSHNSLKATANNTYQFPALRCGSGSYLTIDDERENIDEYGEPVEPSQGRISRTCTLADGTQVTEGDRLTLLDSDDPGELVCEGGKRASAIGGGALEDSGNLTFNGGIITASAYGPNEDRYGAGAGIGGGHAGGGTLTTINGGKITATGSYHGAGIGGGCTYIYGMSNKSEITYALTDAILTRTPMHTIAGDININGGYIKSSGCIHSNAFGQACQGTNNGKTIKITGGTLLPTSVSGWYDIGGSGGYVVVTGGSVRLTGLSALKFQSSDGYAYGDEKRTTKVFLTKIDLSAYGDNYKNALVDNMKFTIGGVTSDYGMPSYTDESGGLYFWLPSFSTTDSTGANHEVKVTITIIGQDGSEKTFPPFYITDATNASLGNNLKQYESFTVDENIFTKTDDSGATVNLLSKRYDGTPLNGNEIKNVLIGEKGIQIDNPPNSYFHNASYIDLQTQRETKSPEGEWELDETESAYDLNKNTSVGYFQLTATSTEYGSTNSSFGNTFWGHRATIDGAEIKAANSMMTLTVSRKDKSGSANNSAVQQGITAAVQSLSKMILDLLGDEGNETVQQDDSVNVVVDPTTASDNAITLTATVSPNDGSLETTVDNYTDAESTTCAAPSGYVQFYVKISQQEDPIALGDPVELKAVLDESGNNLKITGINGQQYNYSTATFEWIPANNSELQIETSDDNKYQFYAEYIGYDQGKQVNYNSCSATGVEVLSNQTAVLEITPVAQGETSATGEEVSPLAITFVPSNTFDNNKKNFTETSTDTPEVAKSSSNQEGGEGSTDPDGQQGGSTTVEPVGVDDTSPSRLSETVVTTEDIEGSVGRNLTVVDSGFTLAVEGQKSTKPLKYLSSNTDVATIDENGVVTIHGCGTTVITITSPADGFYKETSRTVTLTIDPVNTTSAGVGVAKSAVNKTDPNGPTQVSDVITYTLSLENKLPGSLWTDVQFYDPLPAGLVIESGSITLQGPSDAEPVKKDDSCYDKDANTLTVPVGNVAYGEKWTLTFDARVQASALEDDADGSKIENTAEAQSSNVSTVKSDPSFPEYTGTNAGNHKVYAADVFDSDPTPGLIKAAYNNTNPGQQTSVEDRITYTINVQNKREGSVWRDVVLQDPIPAGLNVDADSMYLTKPDGTEIHVSSEAYSLVKRLISIYVGDVYGGQTYTLRFDVVVGEEAVGADIGNTAEASGGGAGSAGRWWSGGSGSGSGSGGSGVSGSGGSGSGGSGSGSGGSGSGSGSGWGGSGSGSGGSWGSGGYSCGDPFFPADGDGVFTDGSEIDSDPIDPVYPNELDAPENGGVLPGESQGEPGDTSPNLTKTVVDETHTDGQTYAEDVLEYDVSLTNPKVGTTWYNVMLFDYLPAELELDRSSLELVRPDGSRQQVSASGVYNAASRTIMMTIPQLAGGETYSLQYKAQIVVDEPAADQQEIVNTVRAQAEDENGQPVEFDGGPEASAAVSWPVDVAPAGAGAAGAGDGAGAQAQALVDSEGEGVDDGVTWVGHWVRRLKAKAALAATGDSALVACGFALAGAAVAAGGVWAARRRARGGSRVQPGSRVRRR